MAIFERSMPNPFVNSTQPTIPGREFEQRIYARLREKGTHVVGVCYVHGRGAGEGEVLMLVNRDCSPAEITGRTGIPPERITRVSNLFKDDPCCRYVALAVREPVISEFLSERHTR